MRKNLAGQQWHVIAFNSSTGAVVTGDAANITANIRIDHGSPSAVTDTNPTELEDGQYDFDITQAESNGDYLALFPESSTANVVVLALQPNYYTTDPITAGVVPTATGTYLDDLIARRDAIAAELAAMSASKAGGLPNTTGDGVNNDHMGYRLSLLAELKVLRPLIVEAQKEAQADAGGVGIVESLEYT